MNERLLLLLGYGSVFGVASVSNCRAYREHQINALCVVVIAACVAYSVTTVATELLWTSERR